MDNRDKKSDFGYRFKELEKELTQLRKRITSIESDKKLLDDIVEIANIGGWEIEPTNGNKLTCTRGAFSIVELNYPSIVPDLSEILSWYLPEYQKMIEKKFEQLLSQGNPIQFDAKIKTKGGNIKWVRTKGKALKKRGKVIKAQGTFQDISKQKQTENELIKQAQFIDKIIDSSEISTWIADKNGTVIRMNTASLNFFGASENEVLGKYNIFKDNVVEEQGFMPIIKKVFNEGIPASLIIDYNYKEVGHVNVKNATHKYVNSFLTPVKDENDNVTNVIVQSTDLTEIKEVERKLAISEERYRLANEATDEGIWDWWVNTNEVYFSNLWKAMIGYKPNELKDSFSIWEELLHPEDKDRMLKRISDFLEKPSKYFIDEFRLKHKNGSYRWIHNKASVVLNQEGKVIRMFGTQRDITEKKNAEKKINDALNEWQTTFNAMRDSVSIIDTNGSIIQCNKATFDMFNITKENIKSNFCYSLIHNSNHHHFDCPLKRLLKSGNHETMIFKKDDKWLRVDVDPIRDENNNITGAVHVVSDITDYKKNEEEISRYSRVFENSLNEIFFIDPNNLSIIQSNSSLKQNTGYSDSELKNLNPSELIPAYKNSIRELLKPLIEDITNKIILETFFKRKNNTLYDVDITFIRIDYKNSYLLVAIALDISDKKSAEKKIKAYQEQLEEKVIERTLELEKKNKELDNALKVFVGRELQIKNLQDQLTILKKHNEK